MSVTAVMLLALALAVAAAVAIDAALRHKGLHDFPLYLTGVPSGYVQRPNQSGRFLNRHAWSYDAHGMRAPEGVGGPGGAVLLVGDSVVHGGLALSQEDTLAAEVAALCGVPCYPLACSGWALANELAALQALPGWQAARRLVLVVNAGDFDEVAAPTDEFNFPTRRPRWLLPWLVRRQLLRRGLLPGAPTYATGPDAPLRERNLTVLGELAAGFAGPISLLAYPFRGKRTADEPYFDALAEAAGAELVHVEASPLWTEACFEDHIHPSQRGVKALAAIISERCA